MRIMRAPIAPPKPGCRQAWPTKPSVHPSIDPNRCLELFSYVVKIYSMSEIYFKFLWIAKLTSPTAIVRRGKATRAIFMEWLPPTGSFLFVFPVAVRAERRWRQLGKPKKCSRVQAGVHQVPASVDLIAQD